MSIASVLINILSAGGAVAVALALLLLILRRQRVRLGKWELIVEPLANADALARAEDRRAHIEAFLRTWDLELSTDITPDGKVPTQEFLETVPGLDNILRPDLPSDRSAACGQMARLIWQVKTPQTLLIERVVDSLLSFRRSQDGVS